MRVVTSIVVAFIACTIMPASRAFAASDATARGVVERAMEKSVAVLRDASLAKNERRQRVVAILEECFDFETFSRLAVGQAAWKEASEAHRAEFVQEFRKHVIGISRVGTNQYGGQDLTVSQDRAEAKGDWTVQTRVIGTKNGVSREVVKIDFRLRQKQQQQQQWKVIDVTIGGISLAATFRAQFAAILKEGGMERAIQILKEKNAATEAVAGSAGE